MSSAGYIVDAYPLSPMQRGMLAHGLDREQPGAYIDQLTCTVDEEIDAEAFEHAWQQVIQRHTILRTAFRWEGHQDPLQEVHAHVAFSLDVHDWRGLATDEREQYLHRYLREDRGKGFDPMQPPLLRVALFSLEEDRSQFVWTFHHVLLDGRSLPLILREVWSFYDADLQGQALQLAIPRPFRDYIEWLQEQDFSRVESFWRHRLAGFLAPTLIPVTQADEQSTRGDVPRGEQIWRLGEEETARLHEFAHAHGLTVNTLVQGAWAILLSRYSGEDDVVFGATRACRRSCLAGAETMVGMFINTLPIRLRVPASAELLQWLVALRSQNLELRDFEHTPLARVQGWSDVRPGTPLFESIIVFENYGHLVNPAMKERTASQADRKVRSRLVSQTSYPLTLAALSGPRLILIMEHDRERFDDQVAKRMLEHLQTLLSSMVTDPAQRLSDLSMLTADERQQLLEEWNATEADYPENLCVHELLEAQADQSPDAIAATYQGKALTYWELNRRANQVAHHLQRYGVGPEVLVGICADRSLDMLIGLLGILKAGGAYVPLDPAYPTERLKYMMDDSRATVIVTQESLLERFPGFGGLMVCLDQKEIDQESAANLTTNVSAYNLAYVIYTSGSTGEPKGVMIRHQSLVNHAHAIARSFRLTAADRVLQFATMSFDVAAEEIFPTWLNGGTVVICPVAATKSLAEFHSVLERDKISVINLPSPYWHAWVSELAQNMMLPVYLRLVVVGSEEVSPTKVRLWQQIIGDSVDWRYAYGVTEATITTTIYEPDPFPNAGVPSPLPIGRPIANAQIFLLDHHLQPVPHNIPGELYIGGVSLARGYLNRPNLTAERFIPNPYSHLQGARLYRTGDIARYRLDGNIELLGRTDSQVKIRGYRVELGEIEAVLSQHPAVNEVVVVAREDEASGKRLVAFIVPRQSQTLTADDLRHFLQDKLPDYMVPSYFEALTTLPLTPNGKIDRRALPEDGQARADRHGPSYTAPRTSTEKLLAEIWSEVLGAEHVGLHDNFFALGGDSLKAIQILARVRYLLAVDVDLQTLFTGPSIASVASKIEGEMDPDVHNETR